MLVHCLLVNDHSAYKHNTFNFNQSTNLIYCDTDVNFT